MNRKGDKKGSKRSTEKSTDEPTPKKKKTTEAERLEKEARAFVEGEGKLKKTLTDYVRDKGPEPSPKKKKTTEAERLEMEARRFVEGSDGGESIGKLKKTLTDFVWDKKSLRQRIRSPAEDHDVDGIEKKADKEEDETEQKVAADKEKKKGTKRKATDPPKDGKAEAPEAKGNVHEYSRFAGQQEISGAFKDRHGNAAGNKYDLIRDNAIGGLTIVVLHSSQESPFTFNEPRDALRKKGFKVILFKDDDVMSAAKLEKQLDTANQLWVISTPSQRLKDEHLDVVKKFFESGRGLALWGDNIPWYQDANFVGKALFGATMHGNDNGQKIIHPTDVKGKPGFLPHLITTGIKNLYEGHTIATITPGKHLQPLMWGTAKQDDSNLICAYYDKDGKRAIMDGGFTRLYCTWDEAGSGRFVTNVAGWLSNLESRLKG